MNCTQCKNSNCRDGIDCSDNKNATLRKYLAAETRKITRSASMLVDNGRAGKLSRTDEVLEFIKTNNYKKVGVAYCFGFEKYARILSGLLKQNRISHSMVCCIVQGITESDIDPAKNSGSISCNPIGQAEQLKNDGVDFIIEMALCLGHDILFHREIICDFTVLVVKDRKYDHCPLKGLAIDKKL
jgi:uncharacterized metal-binding protein